MGNINYDFSTLQVTTIGVRLQMITIGGKISDTTGVWVLFSFTVALY